MNYYKWIKNNFSSLKEKTVVISGATGGIGSAICDYLAFLGANIISIDRNINKYNDLINKLKIKYPNINAQHITVDFENFDNVKDVVAQLKSINIDYLILNAGAYKIPRNKCYTGFDNVFQINFLSPYYIARQLLPQIKKQNGRVVAVSSIAHNYSKIDMTDIDFSTRDTASLVYGNAKRILTLALFMLFKSNKHLSIVHPGITVTNITAHFPKHIYAIIKYPMKLIFMPVKKAALSVLCGLFNSTNTGEWIGPGIFNVWGLPRKKELKTFTYCELMRANDIADSIYEKLTKDDT